jgi:protein SCO1/2
VRLGALLLALGTPAAAQIMGGPKPPDVSWSQELGAEVPLGARFVDHAGRSLTLAECLDDRPVVLALVYYECPMLCGLVLEGMVKALRAVEFTTGVDFDVLVVSIDPGETPRLAAAKRASVLDAYGLAPDAPAAAAWRFLVGDEVAIHALAGAVGFGYSYIPERDEWAHAAGITVLTPKGRVSRVLFGVEFAPRDLRLALVEASEGEIGTPLDQVLLRCFHYDPTRGKYGLAILTLVRALGTLTVLVLTAFVVHWIRRERRVAALGPPGSSLALGLGSISGAELGGRAEKDGAGLEPGAPRVRS